MPDATFACPDLTTFCRLDELGLEVTGQQLEPDRAVLACRSSTSRPTSGAGAVDARAPPATPSPAGWRTSRWAGVPRRCWSTSMIEALSRAVPAALTELTTLGRTLKERTDDVLRTSSAPAPATGPQR